MKKLITLLAVLGGSLHSLDASAALYRVNVSTSLSVRATPSAAATKIGSVYRNDKIDVARLIGTTQSLSGVSGRWAEITYKGKTAYVFSGFLTAITDDTESPSTTTEMTSTGTSSKHGTTLAKLQQQYPAYYANGVFLVDDSEQRMYWYQDGNLIKRFSISTAAKGLGNTPESNQTPVGAHRISTKIGKNAPKGTVFDKLQNTGKIAKIYTQPNYSATALVTSRILRLDGLEAGKNKGGRVDTFSRAIYFHGTNKEGNLGRRASHGCIRMNNDEIIKLYNQVSLDTLVYIQP